MKILLLALTILLVGCQSHQTKPHFWDPVPPSSSTTSPEKIHDDYWRGQFERVNQAVAEAKGTELIFFGDSITLLWSLGRADGKEVWMEHFAKYQPINMGNSGDITPVMLYRANHGNLNFAKGHQPKVAVLLCGTNNYVVKQSDGGKVQWGLGIDTSPAEVADGIRAVAQAFRRQLPETRVILLAILPVANQTKWEKCRKTNYILNSYTYPEDEVVFLDLKDKFLDGDGKLQSGLFTDGTHLTPEGYAVMAEALLPQIERLIAMGPIRSNK